MANNPISQSNQVEFNDSVLTTKAWNSSRYDGRQLSASKINKFTTGDSTYGKTPVIQNYTRNIYIGNSVTTTTEDTTLVNFKDFSYVTINKSITINNDDTITANDIDSNDSAQKIGFYQSFYDDFPLGGNCRLILSDNLIKNNTQKSYTIFSNFGQLRKFATIGNAKRFRGQEFTTAAPINSNYPQGSYLTVPGGFGSAGFLDGDEENNVTINDEEFIQRYYSRSLSLPDLGNVLLDSSPQPFFESIITNEDNFRIFCTFLTPGGTPVGGHAIRTNTSSSLSGSNRPAIITNNLTELSTAEFERFEYDGTDINFQELGDVLLVGAHQYKFKDSFSLNQNYLSIQIDGSDQYGHNDRTDEAPSPLSFVSGGIAFSYADDNTPSLLLNLKKTIELPDDTGDKPFIVVPDNLHPYIKDNLLYFLTQAGIDIAGNTSTILKINPSNRLLK